MHESIQPQLITQRSVGGSRWILLSTSFVIALVFLLYAFAQPLGLDRHLAQLPWLRIEAVTIQVESPLTAERVKSWLPPLEGKSILGVSGSFIVDLLLSKPWVEEVAFKKEYPSRLLISIKSKVPFALATFDNQTGFLDEKGLWIEKVDSRILKMFDLPSITLERSSDRNFWKMNDVIFFLKGMRGLLGKDREVSQVTLGSYPNFRVFLISPRIELIMTFDQWSDQVQKLARLFKNPPQPLSTMRRINLTLPKKAVVSSNLSH